MQLVFCFRWLIRRLLLQFWRQEELFFIQLQLGRREE